ncbi:hypothetical protein F4819DRAFT_453821 [Hypoxylon fuscum]|nr:hypothetical protein F4819DRAFT_453821 [Hypoxylon fuscum]
MLTTLSLAPSCLTETWASQSGTNFAIVLGNPYDTSCWHVNGDSSTTISPAICPVGYTSACDADSPQDGKTVWACCPSGFGCDGGAWSCLKDGTVGVTETYTASFIDPLGNTSTSTWKTESGINAHSVRVAFHSTDIVTTPSSTALSPLATPSLTSPLSTSTSATTPTALSSGNLSLGATVGVGVGIGIGTFIFLSGMAWIWRRYRSGRQVTAVELESHRPSSKSGPFQVQMGPPTTQVGEMNIAPGLHELDVKRTVGELASH